MRKSRENKFGYNLVGTQVVVNDAEAKLLQEMFEDYINGMSASQIQKKVNNTQIRYYEDGGDWSRCTIITILRDDTYKGTDEYPQIITPEIFDKVSKLREANSHKRTLEEKPYIEVFKDKMKCAVCGSKMQRLSAEKNKPSRFHCTNKSCECNRIYIIQSQVEEYLKSLFMEIADGHMEIDYEADIKNYTEIDYEIKKKTNELRLKMQDADNETDDILDEIKNMASMRFDACAKTDNSAQTELIIDTVQKEKNAERVSAETIDKVIKRIVIEPDKRVMFIMLNGKKFIERMT